MEEKSIYIVLSQSGSVPSKLLKFFTHDEYNHVSISLTPTLEQMYSFARLKPNNPFRGGFVEEGKDTGTFKKFKKTIVNVMEIKIRKETKPIFINQKMDSLVELIINQNFIPVIDDQKTFIGIVTRKKVIEYLTNKDLH